MTVKAIVRDVNGQELELEGDGVEIAAILATLNRDDEVTLEDLLQPEDDGMRNWWKNETYGSQSKRHYLLVENMDDMHLANAIVKKTQLGAGTLMTAPFTRETLFDLLENREARAMLSELCERKEIEAREND